MEAPISLVGENSANYVRDAKVNVLRAIRPLKSSDVILGQYVASADKSKKGYLDDPTVSPNSNTPTFAQAVFYVNTPRWEGVPFIMKAGKALDNRKAEIRIQYKDAPAAAFMFEGTPCARNELVLRLQPNEAVYMKMNVKQPGLSSEAVQSELDLSYVSRYIPFRTLLLLLLLLSLLLLLTDIFCYQCMNRFSDAYTPDAYTRLVLDALKGNQAAFVRSDELEVAWRIFTPLLKEIETADKLPLPYLYGSRGPPQADEMLENLGVKREEGYVWRPASAVK